MYCKSYCTTEKSVHHSSLQPVMCTTSAGCIHMPIQGPAWKPPPGLGRHRFLCSMSLEPEAVGSHSWQHCRDTSEQTSRHESMFQACANGHNTLESRGFQEVVLLCEATAKLVASAPPSSTLALGELISNQPALFLQLW